jgi:hypothetical protein
MKLSLTNSDVVKALSAYITAAMPSLEGADIALDYTLTRGANAQLTIDVLVGDDAAQFRKEQNELAAVQATAGRRKRTVDSPVAAEEEVAEDEEQEEEVVAPVAKPATRFKRPASASGE